MGLSERDAMMAELKELREENAVLKAENEGLTPKYEGPVKTRYRIEGDEVVWKNFPVGSEMGDWSNDPYPLMKELKKPGGYVAVPAKVE